MELSILSSTPLGATPDYVRYVAATGELWVTEPGASQLEIFALAAEAPFTPTRAATITVTNEPTFLALTLSVPLRVSDRLAIGDFSSFQSSPTGPRPVVHLSDLRPHAALLAQNPDFQEGALNANVVLRWEYALGSTLFFVYTRSQVPNVALQPGDVAALSLSSVSRAPAADVFPVKLTYWWGGV